MILKLPWSQKRRFWAFEKRSFQVFCKLLDDDVEATFRENETELLRSFTFKIGHRNLFRKWFWSDLEIKNECSGHLEREILVFCKFLSDEVETVFWDSKAKWRKLLNQNLVIESFLENDSEATLRSKMNARSVWKEHFSVFSKVLSGEVETVFWESEAKWDKLFKSRLVIGSFLYNGF